METGPKNIQIGVRLDAGETAVGPILEGEHSKKTYSELIEAYLGRTGMEAGDGRQPPRFGKRSGIFSCSSPTRFNEQEGSIVF